MSAPKKKAKSKKDSKIDFLEDQIVNNVVALREGPKKKTWTMHDLKDIRPITQAQRQMFEAYFMGNNIVATGAAGTGKTFLSCWLALNSIFDKNQPQDRIIIVRSIETTGKDIGALPGEIWEKTAPFEVPYKDIINSLIGKSSAYEDLKNAGKIEFMPTTFIRGLTWDNAVVLIDEFQNNTFDDISSCITRIGENSRFIVSGDVRQQDMSRTKHVSSGFENVMRIFDMMESVDITDFKIEDIVRSGIVREFLVAKESLRL